MGAGIAIVAARAGFTTVCYDVDCRRSIARAGRRKASSKSRSSAARSGGEQLDQIAGGFVHTTELDDLGECDLVIEAVFEDLAIKRALFRLCTSLPEATIFASNTSTLSITEIAGGCGREDRVVGMHFCLPAQLMKLIELSPGMNTWEATLEAAWRWCETAGQMPVRTQDQPGFILNALLVPFNNDASARSRRASPRLPISTRRSRSGSATRWGLGAGRSDRARYPGAAVRGVLPVTLDPRAAAPPLLRRMVAAG